MLLDEAGVDLQSAGLGTRATDLFEGFLPDEPDACVALFDGAGLPPVFALGASAEVARPRVTVWARAATAAAARSKIHAVYDRWRSRGAVDMTKAAGGTTRWLSTFAAHEPFLLKRDERGPEPRVIYACSFDVMKEVSTS